MIAVAGCKQEQPPLPDITPAIHFFWDTQQFPTQRDSTEYSFFLPSISDPDITHDTLWVEMAIMGNPASYDRPFRIEQVNSDDPAGVDADRFAQIAAVPLESGEITKTAGAHYVGFNHPEMQKWLVLPANEIRVKIPVVAIFDESLGVYNVRLKMRVIANDEFIPGVENQREFVVHTKYQAALPALWDNVGTAGLLGTSFGTEKLKYIIAQTGYMEWDPKEDPNPMPTPAVFNYLRDETARAWNKYVQTDEYKANPLREGNGDLVNFVPSTAFTDPNTVLNQ